MQVATSHHSYNKLKLALKMRFFRLAAGCPISSVKVLQNTSFQELLQGLQERSRNRRGQGEMSEDTKSLEIQDRPLLLRPSFQRSVVSGYGPIVNHSRF